MFDAETIDAAIRYLRGELRLQDITGQTKVQVQAFLNTDRGAIVSTPEGAQMVYSDMLDEMGVSYPSVLAKRVEWDVANLDTPPSNELQNLLDELEEDFRDIDDDTFFTNDRVEQAENMIRDIEENWDEVKANLEAGNTEAAVADLQTMTAADAPLQQTQEPMQRFDTEFATRAENESLISHNAPFVASAPRQSRT